VLMLRLLTGEFWESPRDGLGILSAIIRLFNLAEVNSAISRTQLHN
jgi:hypothetical protein